MMDPIFKIYRFLEEDVARVAAEPNDPHIHDFEELLVGVEGQVEHFIDFKAQHFKAPFVSFVPLGKIHRIKPMLNDGKCMIWVIRFASDFIPETIFQLYALYHAHSDLEMNPGCCFERLNSLCEMMHEEMKLHGPNLNIVRDLLKTVFTMVEAEREKYLVPEQPISKTHNVTFNNFLKILEENFKRPEGVDFYAEKLFMSTRNLNLVSQAIFNKSVSELIEMRKLTEAKNLLIYTDVSISEIGYELGFNEKAYFTNVFKKRTGQTPSAFRDEIRKIIS
jgi:AraC family transcriptional regulator, transcriptional activator of pobA